jgi:hypothetical protein
MVGTARCAVREVYQRSIAVRGRRSAASLPKGITDVGFLVTLNRYPKAFGTRRSAHEFSDGFHRFNMITKYLEARHDWNRKDLSGDAPHPTPKRQCDQNNDWIKSQSTAQNFLQELAVFAGGW